MDISHSEAMRRLIADADIVISLLPPAFHPTVALHCLEAGRHFLTASYIPDELKAWHDDVKKKGLTFLGECGLDPGIDHLSAMKIIDDIRARGGTLLSFESFTGGLIAPETDPDNPWRYKFTWNPHNVVTAGQGTARYLYEGECKYIPYQQLFRRTTSIYVPGHGDYEGYANRDSLKYVEMYGLNGIRTMLRGTLRHRGFCAAWNLFVQLGCCDDTYEMPGVSRMTHCDFINAFLPPIVNCHNTEETVCAHFNVDKDSPEIRMLRWSGLFDQTPVGIASGTPARILQHILNKRWALKEGDRDQVVMWHRFRYEMEGRPTELQASLVVKGNDDTDTAMARTVGLPLAIATRLIACHKITARGVMIPVAREFYDPILAELASYGIVVRDT